MAGILVSGCFDIIHAGHIKFLGMAAAFGDLIVVMPTDATLKKYKDRDPAVPLDQRVEVIRALKMVHEVVVGVDDEDPIMNFDLGPAFLDTYKIRMLVVTSDDEHKVKKAKWATDNEVGFAVLPKLAPDEARQVNTTMLRKKLATEVIIPAPVVDPQIRDEIDEWEVVIPLSVYTDELQSKIYDIANGCTFDTTDDSVIITRTGPRPIDDPDLYLVWRRKGDVPKCHPSGNTGIPQRLGQDLPGEEPGGTQKRRGYGRSALYE